MHEKRLNSLFTLASPPPAGHVASSPPASPAEPHAAPPAASEERPVQPTPPAHAEEDEQAASPPPKPKGGRRPGAGRPRKGIGATIEAQGPAKTPAQAAVEVSIGKALTARPAGQVEVIDAPPAFRVVTGLPTVEEALEANAPALLDNAMTLASTAQATGDPFSKMVYLELIKQAIPKHRRKDAKPMQPAQAKATLAALDRIIANGGVEDAEFVDRPEAG